MNLKNILITGVLVASMSTGSVAYATSNSVQSNHTIPARVNKHDQIKTELLNEVADILKLDQSTLIDLLKSGQSINDITTDIGIDKSHLIATLISSEKTELDKEVENGTMSPERKTVILYKLTSKLSTIMDQRNFLTQSLID